MLLMLTVSCSAQQFEDTTALKPRIIMSDFDVIAVDENGATISSNFYRVHFYVQDTTLEVNRQYFVVLEVPQPFDRDKVNYANILGHRISRKQLEMDRQEMLRGLGLDSRIR